MAAVCWAVAAISAGPSAHATPLDQALAAAYEYNPQLDAERARLRATDETVAQAMSGYRPNIATEFTVQSRRADTDPPSAADGRTRPRSFSLSFSQPLFTGFQVRNAVSEAEANVRAGQQTLRSLEQTILLSAVTAYMDVVRDQALLRLSRSNLQFLSRELQATQDRFEVGEVTRTDVAQARASRSAAESSVTAARAALDGSRASYIQVIGQAPAGLIEPAEPRRFIPKTLDHAVEIALRENPAVVAALYLEQAARFNVEEQFGALLPSAQLEGLVTSTRDPNVLTERSTVGTITGRLTVPLYQAGLPRANVRQAKHTHVAAIQEIERNRTEVRAQVVSAWALYQSARAQIVSDRAQVEANQIALEGVREEERVGQRTLLDVLEAQQTLLNSQVTLTSTKRDLIVNAYTLLAAMGRFDGASYGVSTVLYDPDIHYHEVRREWWRISITHRDGREERLDLRDRHAPLK